MRTTIEEEKKKKNTRLRKGNTLLNTQESRSLFSALSINLYTRKYTSHEPNPQAPRNVNPASCTLECLQKTTVEWK